MRPGVGTALCAALLAASSSAGCSASDDGPPDVRSPGPALSASAFHRAAVALVEQREAALRGGDRDAFLATVDDDALQFTATQARWFDNLAAMPVGDVHLVPAGDPTPGDDGTLVLPVDFTMRLDGFEKRSVTQRLSYTFRQDDSRVVLSGDRDARRDRRTGWLPDPWDVGTVEVRESGTILALFDEETSPYADAVMADLVASQRTVLAAVPGWSGRLVAYDISDLTGLEGRTPMKVWDTGGVTYPVPVREGSSKVAAYRFVLNPDVAHNGLQREFLLRHELAHVALGDRDDASPRWLVEGAAEYVSRSEQSIEQQRQLAGYVATYLGISAPVLVSDPRLFYASPDVNYEVAAIACTYLAATQGPQRLWDLMDAFTTSPGADVDAVLRAGTGLDTARLAHESLAWALTGR